MFRYREKWTECEPCARFMDGRARSYPARSEGFTQRPFWKARLDRVTNRKNPPDYWYGLRDRAGEPRDAVMYRPLFAYQTRRTHAPVPHPQTPKTLPVMAVTSCGPHTYDERLAA